MEKFIVPTRALFPGIQGPRGMGWQLPALVQARAQKEGEEEFVFFEQRATHVLVDTVREMLVQTVDPLV